MSSGAYIIEDSAQAGLYLGMAGWSRHRPAALQFASDSDARDWLAQMVKTTPEILRGRKVNVIDRPMDPDQLMPSRPIKSDYDPYAYDVVNG